MRSKLTFYVKVFIFKNIKKKLKHGYCQHFQVENKFCPNYADFVEQQHQPQTFGAKGWTRIFLGGENLEAKEGQDIYQGQTKVEKMPTKHYRNQIFYIFDVYFF